MELLDRVIEIAPDDPLGYAKRALLHHRAERWRLALRDLNRALELRPGHAAYLNNRADVLMQLGRLDEALRDAEQATSEDSEDAVNWITLGEIHIARGEPRHAVLALTKAVELEPTEAAAFVVRADAYLRLGEMELARRDLASAESKDRGALAERIASLRLRLT
jgi:tetratricopeptide (TPR) repeat protein